MNKINKYLFLLTNKYLFINFLIISIFILFINLLELSRIISEDNKSLFNFLYLSLLKYPSIINEIIPFVTIISVSFLIRNLINNNEFVSMRNLGYSIFDIFLPISFAIFIVGICFLLFINPLSAFLEKNYDNLIDNKDNNLYSIKISDNEMWIKNQIDHENSSFINIKDINLMNMNAKDIKILIINKQSNNFIIAEREKFEKNLFILDKVKYYDFKNEEYTSLKILI